MLARLIPWLMIVLEYERVAVFRFGRLIGYRGPGLVWRLPFVERVVRVDLRTVVVDVAPQECITKDNVPVKVNAVTYFRVAEADKAIAEVVDFRDATIQVAQTSLRSVIGALTLDELLSERQTTSERLQEIIDVATDEWGVKVSRVEIKDLEIPGGLRRAMAKEAEAERERRAMVVRARGEREAAQELVESAKILDATPSGMTMRYLQTLAAVAEHGNTTVFSPIDPSAGLAALSAHAGRGAVGTWGEGTAGE